MKVKSALFLLSVPLIFLSCQKNEAVPENELDSPLVICASLDADPGTTKTYVKPTDNKVRWSEGDDISGLNDNKEPIPYTLKGGKDTEFGYFSETQGTRVSSYPYATVYPHDKNLELHIYRNGGFNVYNIIIPDSYTPEDYEEEEVQGCKTNVIKNLPMVAPKNQNNNIYYFKNVCGIIEVPIKVLRPAQVSRPRDIHVMSLTLTSSGPKICGLVNLKYDAQGNISYQPGKSSNSNSITMNFDDTGGKFKLWEGEERHFRFGIIPSKFENGQSITITIKGGITGNYGTGGAPATKFFEFSETFTPNQLILPSDKPLVIGRSECVVLPTMELKPSDIQAVANK